MASTSLPREIFDQIVSRLDRRDVRTMSAVCENWRLQLASSFDNSISIKISSFRFTPLIKDLDKFPKFAHKITQITVTTEDMEPAKLRFIINKCQNLLVLKFTEINIYEYVKMLNSRETLMPKIQNIEIMRLLDCSPAIRRFDVWINYRFRSTITALQFTDIDQNGAISSYGGLMKYLSLFPKLTRITIRGSCLPDTEVLDLNEILTKKPKLESMFIRGKIFNADLGNLPATEEVLYPSLKVLHLDTVNIDIKVLTYIKTRFTKLEDLKLVSSHVSQDGALSEQRAEEIIKDFNESSFEKFNFSYHHRGKYYQNVGTRDPWNSINLGNFFQRTFFDPNQLLLDDDFFFEDEEELLHRHLIEESVFYLGTAPHEDVFSDHGHDHEAFDNDPYYDYENDVDLDDFEEEAEEAALRALEEAEAFHALHEAGAFDTFDEADAYDALHEAAGFDSFDEADAYDALHEAGVFDSFDEADALDALHEAGAFDSLDDADAMDALHAGVFDSFDEADAMEADAASFYRYDEVDDMMAHRIMAQEFLREYYENLAEAGDYEDDDDDYYDEVD